MKNQIMQYFEYSHLPEFLQPVSAAFGRLAEEMDELLPDGPEKSVALRKLLEGKDAAVRAYLFVKRQNKDSYSAELDDILDDDVIPG